MTESRVVFARKLLGFKKIMLFIGTILSVIINKYLVKVNQRFTTCYYNFYIYDFLKHV